MTDSKTQGIVFNIQKYSLHDGEGIRTLVFLKGCPLRCTWCSNPESQLFTPEHAYNNKRCLGVKSCGLCLDVCKTKALVEGEDNLLKYTSSQCTNCRNCTDICPTGGQTLFGKSYTVQEIIKSIEEDEIFYVRSGGGMTLSGGEPLAQKDFALALLREARKARINTAIETCAHYPTSALEEACKYLDTVIMDIKSMDSEKHKEFTGHGNERILENVRYLCEKQPEMPIIFRTPVIPGFNDSVEDIMQIRKFIPLRPNITYEVLTYHRMGEPKYAYLDRPWLFKDVKADENLMSEIRQALQEYEAESTLI